MVMTQQRRPDTRVVNILDLAAAPTCTLPPTFRPQPAPRLGLPCVRTDLPVLTYKTLSSSIILYTIRDTNGSKGGVFLIPGSWYVTILCVLLKC